LKLGYWIIETLKHIGAMAGCYKIILDCSEKNVQFYEKCGFKKKEVEMVWYIPEEKLVKSSKL
jgi:glucosamine-phosphate N-acetyltransferase